MSDKLLHFFRIALYIALFLLVFALFQYWQQEHTMPATSSPNASIGDFHPTTQAFAAPQNPTALSPNAPIGDLHTPNTPHAGKLITIHTDVLTAQIDTQGGNIVESKLLHYPESLSNQTPFLLMNNEPETRYIAESGLLQASNDTRDQTIYSSAATTYALSEEASELTVKLTANRNGLLINKYFIFKRGSYEIKVAYDLSNATNTPWEGALYTSLLRTDINNTSSQNGMMNLATYFGAAISTPDKPFDKITFKSMRENPVVLEAKNGWAAMIQHYFISAWIPEKGTTSTYYSKALGDHLYTVGMVSDKITIAPHGTLTKTATLYTGPAIKELLEQAAPHLKLTIDYGWFWFISEIIFWMMQEIYNFFHNWGVSIILVTLIIKLCFYKLSAKSYHSMSRLKALQPRLEALKERYGSDKQKYTQATLDLYRQEKVNPMGGCLPILVQIPVFIALYWVLVESVQLRQAPFIFWIHDLSKADPYYVLPVLMGISMFLQQRLNPPPPDPMQAKVMMFMPFVFTFLFANFPSGLMLYWFVNNTLSFIQQWFIMHRIKKTTDAKLITR